MDTPQLLTRALTKARAHDKAGRERGESGRAALQTLPTRAQGQTSAVRAHNTARACAGAGGRASVRAPAAHRLAPVRPYAHTAHIPRDWPEACACGCVQGGGADYEGG